MFNIPQPSKFLRFPGPGDGNTDIFDGSGTSLAPSAANPGEAPPVCWCAPRFPSGRFSLRLKQLSSPRFAAAHSEFPRGGSRWLLVAVGLYAWC